jgi:phenylalanyl-tRNA synthetase beta chain
MKFTYNWLKDFVEIKISSRALAEKLTMAGLEVTSLEGRGGDFIFEIEVTSNRPDWLSVIGIAREVAAITGKKLKLPKIGHSRKKKDQNYGLSTTDYRPLSIKIENNKDCPLYTAKIIEGIKVGPSPDWLKKRLELVGCRSVNNIVDITNYILFERGEPLHAFDLDKLNSSAIIVRRAKAGEKIITIDKESRMLNTDILVIADKEKPIAIAGIMGGKYTEVTENTKSVLLEAAVFNPIIIRRARQALGLQSESAYRFERSVNPDIVENASQRAVELIHNIAGGKCILSKSLGESKSKSRNVALNLPTVNKTLGLNITATGVKKILNNLGFEAEIKAKNNLLVKIPTHRQDVNRDMDLIEEVARIYGYENIPKSSPQVSPRVTPWETRDFISLVKNILVGLGLNEVITYSLIDKELLKIFEPGPGEAEIEIMNPLSQEQGILRPRLIPSLTRCVARNLNQKQERVFIFEIAKVFSSGGQPKEELFLGIALSGARSLFFEQGLVKDPVSLLHLKGILEVLFERLGIKNYDFCAKENPCSFDIRVNKEKIGAMAKVQKNILGNLDIKNKDLFALELSLDRFFSYAQLKKKFAVLAKYPGITRDISFILKEDIAARDILAAIEESGKPLLMNVAITDYYKGQQIPQGFRGLTVSCLYRSNERTLTEAEINPAHTLICDLLQQKFGAQIR